MEHGTRLGGRFIIGALAGRGGMGEVYAANDETSGQKVAVKIVRASSRSLVDRFARESWLLSRISHPAIVRYIAHGETEGGQPYLVMEWLDGEDLAKRLSREKLSAEEALVLCQRLAEALGKIHEQGIIHRDIKPQNIFLPGAIIGEGKLLDFGLARTLDAGLTLTQVGAIIGTPGYMSPEQARGDDQIDSRADVFSLGCVLFHCLTGQPPFVGAYPMAIFAKLLLEEPPSVRSLYPEAPEALSQLVARMLSKSPGARPANGAQVVEKIRQVRESSSFEWKSPALTQEEKRLLCLVFLRPGPAFTQGDLPTLIGNTSQRLREIVAPFGAIVELLADGSFMVVFSGTGEVTDQAHKSARCALLLRESFPHASMALTMGAGLSGSPSSSLPVGEVIDRGAHFLHTPARIADETKHGVWLDEVSAGLLGLRFIVRGEANGLLLEGERTIFGVRTLMGKPTPCVGRDRELSNLKNLFEECLTEPRSRAALVESPAGIGKSRLRHEFLLWVEAHNRSCTLLASQGDPLQQDLSFGLLIQSLCRTLSIQDGEPRATQQKKLWARLGALLSGETLDQTTSFLGELLGVWSAEDGSPMLKAARTDPRMMDIQLRRAFLNWLSAECERGPVVFVLEDLHWGDDPSVRYLDTALRALAEKPFFVLALARPEVSERFPLLWKERSLEVIRLGVLSKRAGEEFARAVLGEVAEEALVKRLFSLSGGNAFYLEELCRAAAEGQTGVLPETVVAMAQARIERLPSELRRILRAGSVFGESFWVGGVLALIGEKERLRTHFDTLVEQELCAPLNFSKFPEEEELRFRHAYLREAAYAMLTQEDKRLGHQLAAAWLKQAGEDDATVIGKHHERGGEKGLARACYLSGARHAAKTYNHKEAERLYLLYFSMVETPSKESIGARNELGEAVLQMQGRMDEAREMHTLAIEEARAMNLPQLEAQSLRLLAVAYWITGKERARELMEQALFVSREAGDRALEGSCLRNLAGLHHVQGRREEAILLLEKALDISRETKNRHLEGFCLSSLAFQSHERGMIEDAYTLYEQALTIYREIGSRRSVGSSLGSLASVLHDQGKMKEARDLYEQALTISREVGDRRAEGCWLREMAVHSYWEHGNLERDEERCQEIEALLTEIGDKVELGKLLCFRGHLILWRKQSARAILEQAQSLTSAIGVGTQSELSKKLLVLSRAEEAFSNDRQHTLFRGQLIEDIPLPIRRFLVQSGQLSRAHLET